MRSLLATQLTDRDFNVLPAWTRRVRAADAATPGSRRRLLAEWTRRVRAAKLEPDVEGLGEDGGYPYPPHHVHSAAIERLHSAQAVVLRQLACEVCLVEETLPRAAPPRGKWGRQSGGTKGGTTQSERIVRG